MSATATRCQQCYHRKRCPHFIRSRIAKGTAVHADEISKLECLHARYEMKRINHQEAYSDGRRLHELGRVIFLAAPPRGSRSPPPVAGPYLLRFAQEAAWREDNRRRSNGEQVRAVAGLAMGLKPSVDFCGYKQRHIRVT